MQRAKRSSSIRRFSVGKPERRDHSEDLAVGRKTILKLNLRKYVGREWIRFIWLTLRTDVMLL